MILWIERVAFIKPLHFKGKRQNPQSAVHVVYQQQYLDVHQCWEKIIEVGEVNL
jgi:hypothetical protein